MNDPNSPVPPGILRLTAPARSAPTATPTPPVAEPPPEWMTEGARPHWDRLRPGIVGERDLVEVERTMLALVCESLRVFQTARDQVLRDGLVVPGGGGGLVMHPASRLADSAWGQAMKGLATLAKRAGKAGMGVSSDPSKSRFFRPPAGLAKFQA